MKRPPWSWSSAEPVEFRQKTINLASLAIQKRIFSAYARKWSCPEDIPISLKSSGRTAGLEKRNRISGRISLQGEIQLFFPSMKGKAKPSWSCGMRRLSRSAAF